MGAHRAAEYLHPNQGTEGVDECEGVDELEAKGGHHCLVGKNDATGTDNLRINQHCLILMLSRDIKIGASA